MSNLKSILSSFHLQDELNPKIWELPNERYMSDPKGQDEIMVPKVRERLLQIAYEFIDFIGVDMVVDDVVMTGSLANYNWSKYSDVDLHILVDFKQFSKKELPLYEELFRLKKTLFNDKHNITIFGYDVELYVQDTSEPHTSSGEYSVLFDEWITKPKNQDVEIDTTSIKHKSEGWMKMIDDVINDAEEEDSLENSKNIINKSDSLHDRNTL
jgi:predicted nucleotidyltransferase